MFFPHCRQNDGQMRGASQKEKVPSRRQIHLPSVWRQIQNILVEALESCGDPVGAQDRFPSTWDQPARTLKSCHNPHQRLDYLFIIWHNWKENKGVLLQVLQWLSRQSMVSSDVMSLIPIHFSLETSATTRISIVLFRDTFLQCFVPRYFSHHYRSAGHCLPMHFLPSVYIVSIQQVSVLFIHTIAPTRQNKQTQSNSFHQINSWSNWFRQTHRQQSWFQTNDLNSIWILPERGTIQLCCKTCWENFALTDLSYFRPTDQ